MKRKWEYIADKCREKGYKCSAITADQIDQIMLKTYGDIHTQYWIETYDNLANKYEFVEIISEPDFCIACHIHGNFDSDSCDRCIFARRAGGKCDSDKSPDSLYNKFWNEFEKEESK